MKISEKQLTLLVRVLEGSICFVDRTDMDIFGMTKEQRKNLFEEIINQQSNELVDEKEEK